MSFAPVAAEIDLRPAAALPEQDGKVITTVLTSEEFISSDQHFVRAEGYQVEVDQYFDIKTAPSGVQLRR